ncbi:hypothetical protein TRV_05812 [Trichophyton verrucosum HKI 0517]|uniref:Uncharacterized protein n=1 Tax=Trichophyton verrucosum (strain HKI 0517) TaxID=663202 RepID=D4DF67_TRIVH|nr:uncharacterized protein TRV_05812 [Trichophyton verrucosum HKI 0517]EFE39518.1 hypothetical protein TRV_05812 [Trichophyton verrucosum HKI 0517]
MAWEREWGMEKGWGSGSGPGSEYESGLNLTIALTLALALTLELALLALRDGRGRPRRREGGKEGGREGGREGCKTDRMCKETTLLHMLPERLISTYKLNHDPNDMSHSAHGFWSTEILVSKFLAQREASKAEKLNILIVRVVALSEKEKEKGGFNLVRPSLKPGSNTISDPKSQKAEPKWLQKRERRFEMGERLPSTVATENGRKAQSVQIKGLAWSARNGLQSPKPWWHPRQEDELEGLKTPVRPERIDIGLSLEWICHPCWTMGWLSDFHLDEETRVGKVRPVANERAFGKTTLWSGSGDSYRLQVTEPRTKDVAQQTRATFTYLWSSFECTLFILIDKGLNNFLFIIRNTPEDLAPDVWMHQDILEPLRILINILANKSEFASFWHP